ncbi:MAG: amidohydrolase family protein, partial [Gammaproteobacteria bacterium]|nr:amidohydrolase family protein [Gammaproteobacteria bacterium]
NLPDALKLLTSGPARVLGVDAGHLGLGATADICIFDPAVEWSLDTGTMKSRGKNSPFGGWPFNGRVTHTIIGGRIAYVLS